ncbi:exo-alpha-sialidase [Bacillus mycoides]|uniref:exo-alpha-sialidase n=1 Tax=Bacillus mycoides TaxID=1405 RepID=UPI0021CD8E2F|nr:exo-alpha-sialidase [Bacillus mycoides]MCU5657365.1 exo-alpha-sialidase [Bacillus mycoides]
MPPKPKPNDKEVQVNNPATDVANFPLITQSETSLAHFNDFILYGFNDSNDELTRNSFSGFAFSKDLGKTWTDGGSIPTNPGGVNNGDPIIAVDKKGVFYYGQIGQEVVGGTQQDVISVSTGVINSNKTITMNPPRVVGRGQNPQNGNFSQDKEWITVGPDRNRPGQEALYVVWTDFTSTGGNARIRFSKYTTGVQLNPLITDRDIIIPPNANTFVRGANVVVDKQGNIYVLYEQILNDFNLLGQPNRTIRIIKSTDGGNTFPQNTDVAVSPPFAAAANQVVLCDQQRAVIFVDAQRDIRNIEFPQASIGPDGTIYVVWNAGTVINGQTFINVFLAFSRNQGATWSPPLNVTQEHFSFAFFPSVAANAKGAHIQYNRFNDPAGIGGVGNGTFGIFKKTFSVTGGLSPESVVSNPSSPVAITRPPQDPGVAICYMADYNQVVTGPRDSLLHAWSDNRNRLNGLNNPDVFFRKTDSKKKP